MNRHVLEGCKPIPISNYLKSLGLLRIISEQTDPGITGYWKHEKFIIETHMKKEEIVEFILKKYSPTPILIPWSYKKYQKTIKKLEKVTSDKRFAMYEKLVSEIKSVINEFKEVQTEDSSKEKELAVIIKKQKNLFLKLCRNMLSDEIILWLDAVFVLSENDAKYASILGSGGNDGNYDMAENFVAKIIVLLSNNKKENIESEKWLRDALFDDDHALQSGSVIGHNPDGDGDTAPNAGMGFTGKSLSNPWDYVLMMEGTLLFAGNMTKRHTTNTGKAAFPFSTNISNVGYATASNEEDDRGEIWTPIWNNPTTYTELSHIFREGRVQLGRRQAETGAEFARAVIGLGIERGINEFNRYCVMKRKGDAHLYNHAGRVLVADDSKVDLLDEIDWWYREVLEKSKKKDAAESLKRLVKNHDMAVLNYCKYRKESDMLEILISVGRIHRRVSRYEKLKTLQRLSAEWIEKCYDGSSEFRLATSLASIQSSDIGSIRENLENIKQENGQWKNDQDFLSYVWNENDDLVSNMNRVLIRRAIDGKIKALDEIPIRGNIPARISDIIEFLNGTTDMKKIGNLLLPLSIIDLPLNVKYPWKNARHPDLSEMALPQAYMIMKLIYPPDKKEGIPYDITTLNLLNAKRNNKAHAKASYILHSHGLSPKTYIKNKGMPKNTIISNILEKFLMASLLFPLSVQDRKTMVDLTTI